MGALEWVTALAGTGQKLGCKRQRPQGACWRAMPASGPQGGLFVGLLHLNTNKCHKLRHTPLLTVPCKCCSADEASHISCHMQCALVAVVGTILLGPALTSAPPRKRHHKTGMCFAQPSNPGYSLALLDLSFQLLVLEILAHLLGSLALPLNGHAVTAAQ